MEPADAFASMTATAQRVECEHGYGVTFADGAETVLLSPVHGTISGAGVHADAAAVVLAGDQVAVVGARRVRRGGHTLLDVAEPVSRVLEVPR